MKSLPLPEMLPILEPLEVFSRMKPSELKVVAGFCALVDLEKDQCAFSPGDPGKSLFIVVSGEIIMKGTSSEGESVVLAQLISGDIFGELEFFAQHPRDTFAQAGTSTKILRFPAHDWEHFLNNHPKTAGRILQNFLAVIASRIRKANELVRENSQVVQDLRRQVYGDKMTGLLNKTWLEETLPTFLKDPQSPVALWHMKPDNFKYINDTFGHEAGDRTLNLMATALSGFIGKRGTAFRYLGNELGVVIQGIEPPQAKALAHQLLEHLKNLDLSSIPELENTKLSVSIGIGTWPEDSLQAQDLIAKIHELPLIGRGKGGNLILTTRDLP